MNGLRHFRNIIFALAAFLWLPASAHCQLEAVPGLEFLHCAADSDNSKGDCKEDGCCSVEKSQYKSEQHGDAVLLPAFLPVDPMPVPDMAHSLPADVSVGILTAAPPELPASWRFVSRAALPARAHSLAS